MSFEIQVCQGLGYKGLDAGFAWRHTFVRLWEKVGREVGVKALEVQSGSNNLYITEENADRLKRGHDDVANDIGFDPDPLTRNWVKPLGEPKLP